MLLVGITAFGREPSLGSDRRDCPDAGWEFTTALPVRQHGSEACLPAIRST